MENPEGRGAQAVLEGVRGGGVKKPCLLPGGVDFFWNNPMCLTWPWFRRVCCPVNIVIKLAFIIKLLLLL